jgi:molecular chaperone GrpE
MAQEKPEVEEVVAADTQSASRTGTGEAATADEPVEPVEPVDGVHTQSASPTGTGAAAEPEAPVAEPEPDFKDQWLRAAADLENVRKRARRDVASAETRGVVRLARELLPAIDNFERALDAAEAQPENADHHLTDGIRLVKDELLGALARVGIEPDSPKGELFDPHRHEAVAQQPVEGTASGTIVEVYSQGYRIGDDVLRAAKVVVAA